MLNYNFITDEIQAKIDLYNAKANLGGRDAMFYSNLADKLQTALTTLQAIGSGASQQDMINAWNVYRVVQQDIFARECARYGAWLLAGSFVLGIIIGTSIRKKSAD